MKTKLWKIDHDAPDIVEVEAIPEMPEISDDYHADKNKAIALLRRWTEASLECRKVAHANAEKYLREAERDLAEATRRSTVVEQKFPLVPAS